MERRPRKQKTAGGINKNLAKNNADRKKKLLNAFPEARIPEWRLKQKEVTNLA